jgi:hypothetical protein
MPNQPVQDPVPVVEEFEPFRPFVDFVFPPPAINHALAIPPVPVPQELGNPIIHPENLNLEQPLLGDLEEIEDENENDIEINV